MIRSRQTFALLLRRTVVPLVVAGAVISSSQSALPQSVGSRPATRPPAAGPGLGRALDALARERL